MKEIFTRFIDRVHVDWYLFAPAILLSLAGLVTMNSFSGEDYFFFRQSIWILLSVSVFFFASAIDWHFLRRTKVIVPIFLAMVSLLILVLLLGEMTRGTRGWFNLGFFAFQPADTAKLVLILVLAKYFSRRHIAIKNLLHVVVSGVYAFMIFFLIFLQPDFGTAVIVFGIWFGMVLVSGISKKHLALVALAAVLAVLSLWFFVFTSIQKDRIISFLHPLADVQGAGYHAYQSTIAVGSGQIFGKGIGQGSQSKLLFLPDYQTDFIFAAFVEEWGFVGAILILVLSLMLLFRILNNAERASTNFETLVSLGVAIFFSLHITIHAGMNVGILPVTGIPFPFMSYGGSHLLTEWFILGILSSMKRHSRAPRV